MIKKIGTQIELENFILRHQLVTLNDLYKAIRTKSRMTVFRRLKGLEYLSSFTHAGRYYTLKEMADFDLDGIWFFNDIGFSQNGSLKNTLIEIVNTCAAGKFHFELENQLRVRVQNTLLNLVKLNEIDKAKFEGKYLYLSIEQDMRKRQEEQRHEITLAPMDFSRSLNDTMVIEVLAEVIRSAGCAADSWQVASNLEKRGCLITVNQIRTVFDRYGIEKKISDSP